MAQLDEIAVLELGALASPAPDQRAVLRAEILDGPGAEHPAEQRVRAGHPGVVHADGQAGHPRSVTPRNAGAVGAAEHHLVDVLERAAHRRGAGAVAAEHQEDVRRSGALCGAALHLVRKSLVRWPHDR